MTEKNDLATHKEILAQEIQPLFIKTEEIADKSGKVDFSKVYVLPTIKIRYFSTLCDVLVIFLVSLGISFLFESIGAIPDYVRGVSFVVVVILYEPILVSIGATIGQLLMNIRIRNINNPEKKLPFHLNFIRFVFKLFLGWLSFITVTFNINRRAIHDFASGSIMISTNTEG